MAEREEHLPNEAVARKQLEFFQRNKAGCAFAALAAKNPEQYGWCRYVLTPNPVVINALTQASINQPGVNMVSLIIPDVASEAELMRLILLLGACEAYLIEQNTLCDGALCIGIRVRAYGALSWVSGFGPFDFLPETRRTPFTELTFRTKPRPEYDAHIKAPVPGTLHVADLDFGCLPEKTFRKLGEASFIRTEQLLGHKPDLRSAAKTTFVIATKAVP